MNEFLVDIKYVMHCIWVWYYCCSIPAFLTYYYCNLETKQSFSLQSCPFSLCVNSLNSWVLLFLGIFLCISTVYIYICYIIISVICVWNSEPKVTTVSVNDPFIAEIVFTSFLFYRGCYECVVAYSHSNYYLLIQYLQC